MYAMRCMSCHEVIVNVCSLGWLFRWFVMKLGAAEHEQCSVMNHSCCTVLAITEGRVGAGTVEWLFTLSLYSVQYFSHSLLSYSQFLWLIAEWLRAAKLSLPMVPDFSHMTEWHTWCSVFFSRLLLSSLSQFLSRSPLCSPCISVLCSLIFSGFSDSFLCQMVELWVFVGLILC